jgi:O-acetyl-ADP-ribose deacetylase (regulator of RNase III)
MYLNEKDLTPPFSMFRQVPASATPTTTKTLPWSPRKMPHDETQLGTSVKSQPNQIQDVSLAAAALERKDFHQPFGLLVSVYKADITRLYVDVIANASNEQLMHGGGVAYAIAMAAGYALEDECRNYISQHGPLKVSEVMASTGGNLPHKKVLHTVGPRWEDYKDKSLCQQVLVDTVFNCLNKADQMGFHSIALPSISSGEYLHLFKLYSFLLFF